MNFKQIFNFKQRFAELINVFKNIKSFDFLGRLTNIVKDIPGLVALAGATFMFIGSFIPNFWAGLWGIKEYMNLFQSPWGVFMFLVILAIMGLAYFKQIFWAGLASALCFTISIIQAIAFPAAIKLESGGWFEAGVHVGWFFIFFAEIAVMGAFVLNYFVFNKTAAPVIEAEATPAAPVAEAPVAEAPVAPVAEAATVEEVPATSDAE